MSAKESIEEKISRLRVLSKRVESDTAFKERAIDQEIEIKRQEESKASALDKKIHEKRKVKLSKFYKNADFYDHSNHIS